MVLSLGKCPVAALSLMLTSIGLIVVAQPICAQNSASAATAAASEFSLADGEILLEGKLSSANPAQKTFVLTASSFTLPNGKTSALSPAKPKKRSSPPQRQRFNVRGDSAQKVELESLLPGAFIIVVGKDAGSGQALTARQIAVWDKVAAGKYSQSTSSLVRGQTALNRDFSQFNRKRHRLNQLLNHRVLKTHRPNSIQAPRAFS
jgi:hypothetical protein